MIAFVWGTVVCAAILMAASAMLPGVRCNSFGDAVKTSLIYGILSAVITRLLALPIVLTSGAAAAMTFGLGLPFAFLFWGLVVGTLSMFLADKLVDGFEIDGIGGTAGVVVFLGVSRIVAALLGIL